MHFPGPFFLHTVPPALKCAGIHCSRCSLYRLLSAQALGADAISTRSSRPAGEAGEPHAPCKPDAVMTRFKPRNYLLLDLFLACNGTSMEAHKHTLQLMLPLSSDTRKQASKGSIAHAPCKLDAVMMRFKPLCMCFRTLFWHTVGPAWQRASTLQSMIPLSSVIRTGFKHLYRRVSALTLTQLPLSI